MTMVIHSIKQRGVYSSGVVADQNRRWRKNAVRYSQLDKMARRLNTMEKQLADVLASQTKHLQTKPLETKATDTKNTEGK